MGRVGTDLNLTSNRGLNKGENRGNLPGTVRYLVGPQQDRLQ